MGFRPFGHKDVMCRVSFRQCPICHTAFQARPSDRRKFCQDRCTAEAIVRRTSGRYTIESALAHMRRQRTYRDQRRRYYHEVVLQRCVLPIELPPPVKSPVRNTHVPGSIAFALLYGDRRPVFSRGDGQFVGRGGRSTRAIQRGGVST